LAKLGKKCEEKIGGFLSGFGDYNVGTLSNRFAVFYPKNWEKLIMP